jgi:multidrug efflux pump
MVQPQLSSIKGVQRADVLGGRVFAMRVWLKPEELAARGISPSEVAPSARQQQRPRRGGLHQGLNDQRESGGQHRPEEHPMSSEQLVVAERNGAIVRLSDVAEVVLGAESYDDEVRFGGQTATFMGIWVLPTESTVEVIKRVRDTMPEIERSLPAGLKAKIAYDATGYIDDA